MCAHTSIYMDYHIVQYIVLFTPCIIAWNAPLEEADSLKNVKEMIKTLIASLREELQWPNFVSGWNPRKTAVNRARVKPALSLGFCTIWSPWQEQNEDQEKQKFCVGGAQKDWIWCEWYQIYSGNCEKMQQVWWWWWWFWSYSLVDKLHRGCRRLIQMCI